MNTLFVTDTKRDMQCIGPIMHTILTVFVVGVTLSDTQGPNRARKRMEFFCRSARLSDVISPLKEST